MRVHELIEVLRKMPQGSDVYVYPAVGEEFRVNVVMEDDFCGGANARVALMESEP